MNESPDPQSSVVRKPHAVTHLVTRLFRPYFRGNLRLPETLYFRGYVQFYLEITTCLFRTLIWKPRIIKAGYQYVRRHKITMKQTTEIS